MSDLSAVPSGTFTLGNDMPIVRLGYGAMQITGDGVWGEPRDRDEAIAVVRRAVELGVTFFDTADSYGPDVSEEILAEAIAPYDHGIVVATKAGLTRTGPGEWKYLQAVATKHDVPGSFATLYAYEWTGQRYPGPGQNLDWRSRRGRSYAARLLDSSCSDRPAHVTAASLPSAQHCRHG